MYDWLSKRIRGCYKKFFVVDGNADRLGIIIILYVARSERESMVLDFFVDTFHDGDVHD